MKRLYESPLMEIEKFTIINVVTDVSGVGGGVGDNGDEVGLQDNLNLDGPEIF